MKKDLLVNTSGFILNILEKVLDADIEIKGKENIPKNHPRIFVANHLTRMEAMIVPYAIYDLVDKKVGVIADDSLFKTYFGSFLEELGAMRKSEPCRNNIMIGDLITGCKDWMIFPEGMMVKAKDITKEGEHFCVKIDDVCQKVHTGSAFFALSSQLLREDYFNNKIKNSKKFQRKYFIKECKEIQENETMIVPINITYSNLRTGKNFLTDMAIKFLDKISENFLEELEIEGNIALNSKITIQILKPISTKKILADIYDKELNHTKIINKYRYSLTHNFMTKIYKSLTINFDHIFTLTLFIYEKEKINKIYFKRILYLIANEIKMNCIYYNENLDEDIIKLVSYENFEPFESILNVAIKDEILSEMETEYVIHIENLMNLFTHHTIRLRNIMRVILNEVLIIEEVNDIVKKLINLSENEINEKLYKLLKKEEIYEYENDYAIHIDDEDLKPKNIGIPYSFENNDSNTCVITIHGFSSSPKEVLELSQFLHKKGLNVYAPRLKGHGTSPKDLKDTTWNDWYLSLSRAIALVTLKYKKIFIIGFSTGGLLALLSTKKCYPQIKGIICINSALHLNDIRIKTLLPALSFWNDLVVSFNANDYAKEYVDNVSENPELNYNKHYIKAIEQLDLLMTKTRKNIPKIQTPTFIIQAKNDPVVNPTSAYEIYEKIKSEKKEILMLDLDNHIIIKGENTKELFERIYLFLDTLEKEY
ncbi:MAG: glycerol acyltransferase [Arcobacter sp.]|nr:MAG: glycerol acyltransferase [Arcobacter sp.]